MRRHILLPFTLLMLVVVALSVDPLSQLRQLLAKERKVNWMGKQIYILATRRGSIRFEAILKKARPNKIRLEFLSPPSFAGYAMVWEGEKGAIIPPEGKKKLLPPLAPVDKIMDMHLELLSKSAKVKLEGEQKILGRTAAIFLIEPAYVKGGYLKIWVDKQTGIRLKTERYSPKGKLLSSITLLSLQLNPSFEDEEEEFEVPAPLVKPRDYSPEELQHILHFRPLLPSYLPPGYTILHLRPLFAGRQRAAVIHLTDGLNPITIMETPHIWKHPPLFNHYEQEIITLFVKGLSVALTGNVERDVLEKIGLSLR